MIEDVRWGAAINHGAIVDRLREGGFERATIGICDSLPHDMWLYLREALPEARLIEARDLMFEVRLCPSEEELNWYRKGARLCDLAFEAAVDAARPGMKEYELVGVIHGTYLRHGGSLYGAAR